MLLGLRLDIEEMRDLFRDLLKEIVIQIRGPGYWYRWFRKNKGVWR